MAARVVDASVLAAWCFREPRASEALRLLQGSDLHAPVLLAYEVTSIARRKAAEYPERLDDIGGALEAVLALPIHWGDVDHSAVLRLALETDLTTYDASYLCLARALGATLVTFDQRLARAAHDAGI